MRGMDGFSQQDIAATFADNRQRLSAHAEKRLNPFLLKRLSVEDVLSEAYENAAKRLAYFAAPRKSQRRWRRGSRTTRQ